jgi:hypothetical protein
MGHWESGPLDNDGSLDWLDELIKRHIQPALESDDYAEVRAGALILKALAKETDKIWIYKETFDFATTKLLKILNDKEWLNKWKDPDKTRISVLHQIYSLWNKK